MPSLRRRVMPSSVRTPARVWLPPKRASFHEARAYAMMHLAIHDALNAIDRKYQPYAYDKKADPGTSPDAAVAAAARDGSGHQTTSC